MATADAETLFRRGRASAEAGDYAHACVAFAESLRLEKAPGTLLNLADCEERTGRLASAWSHYIELEGAVPARDERRPLAHDRAAALAARVPWMAITLGAGTPPDARVFRDDVELAPSQRSEPAPVDPGAHRVLVVAPGHEARTVTVSVSERETAHVVVSAGPVLRPPVTAAAVPPRADPPVRSPDRTAAWVAGAAGVAALGVGAFFGVRALNDRGASDAACAGSTCSTPAGLAAYDSARSEARAADVALGLGVVGLAVAGVLLVTARPEAPGAGALSITPSGVGGVW